MTESVGNGSASGGIVGLAQAANVTISAGASILLGMRVKRTVFCLLLSAAALACAEDPLRGLEPGTEPAIPDATLQALTQASVTWTYFKNSPALIPRASTSPHPETTIRVRYNPFAASQLDATGRVSSGAVFPDSSVIDYTRMNGAHP